MCLKKEVKMKVDQHCDNPSHFSIFPHIIIQEQYLDAASDVGL